jgi:hypothetical protein
MCPTESGARLEVVVSQKDGVSESIAAIKSGLLFYLVVSCTNLFTKNEIRLPIV